MNIICAVIGHRPDRRHTWHDKLDWRTDCVLCRRPLLKDTQTRRWRAFDPERDFTVERKAKPDRRSG